MITIKMNIKRNSSDWQEAVAWCNHEFGPSVRWPDILTGWTYDYQGEFNFTNEQDAMMFALRWV
jgi:hypothetical protein